MILYRSTQKKGGTDYSLSYTDSVNGTPNKGSCAYMFVQNYKIKNNNIVIGNNVNSCWRMFDRAYYFNGNVTIPNSVTNVGRMFWNCHNFNQNIIIPNSVSNTFGMFTECWDFNQNITIPNSVTEAKQMFLYCNKYFNHNIQLPNTIVNTTLMFADCTKFNQKIFLQNLSNIIHCESMFENCTSLNKEILGATNGYTWAKKPFYMNGMFRGCTKYDQTTYISDNAVGCQDVFDGCTSFSSTVMFSENYTGRDIRRICNGCNSPYIPFIPNSVIEIGFALANCRNITDSYIQIGTSVNNCDGFLFNCNNFNGTLNFLGNVPRKISMNGIFSASMTKKKNIYFGNAINGQINKLTVVSGSTYTTPTWTTTSYGYYNATYNIYCYWR